MSYYSNEDASIVVFKGSGTLFEGVSTPRPQDVKSPNDQYTHILGKIAPWGEGNDFPQIIMAECEKNSDLGSFLDLQARIMYAGGVSYEVMDPQTGKHIDRRIPEIDRFLFQNWGYPIQSCKDFYMLVNTFPEMILGKNREKIHWLIARPAAWCRYGLQDKNGKIPKVYISSDWSALNSDTMLERPVINPLFEMPENLRERKDGFKYIYPLSYPSGRSYYQLANWNAIRMSKWLELANKIPAFKLAVMNNQITIKYHIQIPDYYWEWKYEGKWHTFTPEERKAKKEAEIEFINTFLKGEEKAGKSITTGYKLTPDGKELPGIKITAIDDKMKDGMYLEDSVEATIKLFSAIGLDPSILGIVPGKGGSNRAGSDKREALNIYISMIQMHIDIVLRPYDFISYYNGWNTDQQMIRWYFRAPLLQTLDKIKPSERESVLPKDGGDQ